MNGLDQKIVSPDKNFSMNFHYLNESSLREPYYSVSLIDEKHSEKFKLAGIFSFSENQIWSADSRFVSLEELHNNIELETLSKEFITFDTLNKKKLN